MSLREEIERAESTDEIINAFEKRIDSRLKELYKKHNHYDILFQESSFREGKDELLDMEHRIHELGKFKEMLK
jgi:hypothetical protein